MAFLQEVYPSFGAKVREAAAYADPSGPLMTDALRDALTGHGFDVAPHSEHLAIVRAIREALATGDTAAVKDLVQRAALVRRFLG